MASKLMESLPTHLKPNGGAAEPRHHGKSQSHVVRFERSYFLPPNACFVAFADI